MKKKIGTNLLACMLFAGACAGVAGCGGTEKNNGYTNPNATKVLNIAYFNGGVTAEWLRALEAEYEKLNPDVEVYINDELKDEIKDQKLMQDIKQRKEDIFFTHEISYSEFVNRELIADITDVVQSVAATGEDTVENRMNENLRKYYGVEKNGETKYYGVPFYTNFSGAIYDVDLFEKESLYLAADGTLTSGLTGAKAKSLGKDGVEGSYDDGFPVTFSEYKTWLSNINKKVTPYIWCTDNSYRIQYLNSLWIGYEGVNDYSLNSTFAGTTKAGEEITPATAYKLRSLKGREFGVEMAKEIISKKYYHSDSVNGSITHVQAQNTYLRSRAYSGKAIAMILEGGWWEIEASATFKNIAKSKNDQQYAKGNRRFAYVPVPVYDGPASATSSERAAYIANAEKGESFHCTSANIATVINKSTKQLDLAKDFLKFTLTEHAMSTFTKNVGMVRPYDYDLEEGVYESLTPFAKNTWDLCAAETSKIYYPIISHEFLKNTNYFGTYEWSWGATIGGKTQNDPFLVFLNNKSVTAADYIEALVEHYSANDYTTEYNHWLQNH